ncbi:MAG: hypothetical protein IJZ85_10975 [Lachnospiraceae bacterium]|nr:hypothetical protein [Lachnospiraceae bacterium]
MKKILGIMLATFVIMWIASFALVFSILHVFCEFELISTTGLFTWTCIFASVLSVLCLIITIVLIKTEKKTKLENWLSNNRAKMMLAYTFITVFCLSIKAELIMTIEEMKEIISLSWSISGISMAIFLIWNVIAIEYLENKKPNKPTSCLPTKTWKYIQARGDFYHDATTLLSSINLMLVTMLFLVTTTVFVYVSSREATVFAQSMSILGLLLCTNTVLSLLFDILKPFNEKKKAMLQESKVTNVEVELQNEINKQTEITLGAIEAVENTENISQEVKMQVIAEIINCYSNRFRMTPEEQLQTKGE